MKGVILAGGTGTRLHPLTKITNKHLLPVYNQPMVYYPIQTLVNAGVTDILIVTGGNHAGEFLPLLGNGADFGLKHLNYTHQARAGGIAEALGLAKHFVGDDHLIVMLGDNLIEGNLVAAARDFSQQERGAKILITRVEHPEQYGVVEFDGDKVARIVEKPAQPTSNWVQTGIYFYDNEVFDIVRTLKPSGRGELEITDVNNEYIHRGTMTYEKLQGWWGDAGEDIDELLRVSNLVAQTGANKL